MIPYGRQTIDDDDVQAVVEVLRSDWLTQGPMVNAFEAALAERVGARHAVAFSSGTAALHGAVHAVGLGPGDLVVTSALTFVASANCAAYAGAAVDLVDIDPATLNLDTKAVPEVARAAVLVHFAGLPVDARLLPRRGLAVIEDASHALGAETGRGPVGCCADSDVSVFSFHPVKHVTTGEGGMATTNDDEIATRLRAFRSHGIVRCPERGGWYYEVADEGYNYRLTDIQAALGLSQLAKLDRFLDARRRLAARYRELLADLPIDLPPHEPAGVKHAYHLFAIRVPHRRAIYDHLQRAGVGVQVHYVPVHHHPRFSYLDPDRVRFPNADRAYEGLLSLPLYPALRDEEQDLVVEQLRRALRTVGAT